MASREPLAAFIERTRVRVDAALEKYLPSAPGCPTIMSEAMRYSVFAGGKRFRPILTLAAADAVARHADDAALPAACAIELIHTYSLIHDDLPAMDNDTLRRGVPTLHVVQGDGIAILAGDGLHAEAFGLLAREPQPGSLAIGDDVLAARKLRVILRIAEAAGAIGMVGGQAIDLQAAGKARGSRLVLDADGLRSMHARKTGALIRVSAASGAIMGGADDGAIDAVDRYAADVGLAFQIVDDILDVEGESAALGKTTGKDAAEEKPTYPALFGMERSRALASDCITRANAALADAQLTDSWLSDIAGWILNRRS